MRYLLSMHSCFFVSNTHARVRGGWHCTIVRYNKPAVSKMASIVMGKIGGAFTKAYLNIATSVLWLFFFGSAFKTSSTHLRCDCRCMSEFVVTIAMSPEAGKSSYLVAAMLDYRPKSMRISAQRSVEGRRVCASCCSASVRCMKGPGGDRQCAYASCPRCSR